MKQHQIDIQEGTRACYVDDKVTGRMHAPCQQQHDLRSDHISNSQPFSSRSEKDEAIRSGKSAFKHTQGLLYTILTIHKRHFIYNLLLLS